MYGDYVDPGEGPGNPYPYIAAAKAQELAAAQRELAELKEKAQYSYASEEALVCSDFFQNALKKSLAFKDREILALQNELLQFARAAPSPPVAAVPATPVDSELWAILVDVNGALEDGVDALSEVRANFREAYKGHRPEEHAAKERDLLNAEDARARLAEYMDRPRPAAQPQPQPAQPLTDEQIQEIWVEHGLDDCDVERFARLIEEAHGITAPSTPTPPEVAP